MNRLGIVVIGRNEGDRLRRCLASLRGTDARIVYVDSGSTDDSVSFASSCGVETVSLDLSAPFTAARGRNAGVDALREGGLPELIQFVDGDCIVVEGWLEAAVAELDADPGLGLVTGWRSEQAREESIYNQMCDVEWHRPACEIRACGGDFMVRSDIFDEIGGFDPGLICSEDEDFVLRLRKAGHMARRLPLDMTSHDANMTRFSQWWRRTLRAGHGFAEVGRRHRDHFISERRRAWAYGLILPLTALIGAIWIGWIVPLTVLAIYALSWWRTARGLAANGQPAKEARNHAAYYTLAKLPHLLGMLLYHFRRLRGSRPELIEYK
jgi:GT2 family glycosyltransferase